MKDFSFTLTRYGLKWGPLEVVRMFSDPYKGIALELATKTERLQVRVTRLGSFRVSLQRKKPSESWNNVFSAQCKKGDTL